MNWLWLLSLVIYVAAILIGVVIIGRIEYRRGVRDGMAKKLYAAYKEYTEQHKEDS